MLVSNSIPALFWIFQPKRETDELSRVLAAQRLWKTTNFSWRNISTDRSQFMKGPQQPLVECDTLYALIGGDRWPGVGGKIVSPGQTDKRCHSTDRPKKKRASLFLLGRASDRRFLHVLVP